MQLNNLMHVYLNPDVIIKKTYQAGVLCNLKLKQVKALVNVAISFIRKMYHISAIDISLSHFCHIIFQ